MDEKRKKELREEYKNSKSSMGVYQIKNIITEKAYIGITQDLKGTMNGNSFKLDSGFFKNRELQSEWQVYGRDQFEISILAELDYSKDETKSDYTDDLIVLRDLVTVDTVNKKYI